MGVGPIPTQAIIVYAEKIEGETDRDEIRRFFRLVRAIDTEFLEVEAERSRKDK